MRIGICGNIDLNRFAGELDKKFPDYELIVGDPERFSDELMTPVKSLCDVDFCIVAVDWHLLAIDSYNYSWTDNFDAAVESFNKQSDTVRKYIEAYRAKSSSKIFLFSPLSDNTSSNGFLTRLLQNSSFDLSAAHQKSFNNLCASITDLFPVDIDLISNRIGKEYISDVYSDQLSMSELFLKAISDHICKMIVQFQKYPLKCLVLDLDNTLWGGIIGESGIDSIQLDNKGPGAAYKYFQYEILKLYKQGVILAICSKNNTCDALEVIEQHPHMVIRPPMISCFRINWDDKPKSMVSIATELNIGLDSIMFIDDNPVERALMKNVLPQVEVLELPEHPALYAEVLKECSRFWPVQLTKEDIDKNKYFSLDRIRKYSEKLSGNIENFLRTSEIILKFKKADKTSIERITQLFNKTNQFNLTTTRYSQTQLELLLSDQNNHLFCMEMTDRFGDYGIIAAALLKANSIDSFVLSCRAFGKQAEKAFLVCILQCLKDMGEKEIFGYYVPSLKNSMTKNFYEESMFELVESKMNNDKWKLDLSAIRIKMPDWFTLRR